MFYRHNNIHTTHSAKHVTWWKSTSGGAFVPKINLCCTSLRAWIFLCFGVNSVKSRSALWKIWSCLVAEETYFNKFFPWCTYAIASNESFSPEKGSKTLESLRMSFQHSVSSTWAHIDRLLKIVLEYFLFLCTALHVYFLALDQKPHISKAIKALMRTFHSIHCSPALAEVEHFVPVLLLCWQATSLGEKPLRSIPHAIPIEL